MKYVLVLYTLILIICGCNTTVQIVRTNETTISETLQRIEFSKFDSLRKNLGLTYIDPAQELLAGLKPQYPMAIGVKKNMNSNCLYYDGCKNPNGYSLIIKMESGYKQLTSAEQIKEYFAPITNKQEALSYAIVNTGLDAKYEFEIKRNYRKFVKQIKTTSVEKNEEGYIVNLFDYILCGCGPHSYLMKEYLITEEGDLKLLETIKLYEDPEQDGLCVD